MELVIKEGQKVTFTYADRTFKGVVVQHDEQWFVRLSNVEPGEPREISIFLTKS